MSVSHRLQLLWNRIIRPLAAISVIVLLGGCSAIKLAYTNLPDISYWWIDGYADLGETQSVQLRSDLARLHQWHRQNELPKVADLLQQVQRDAQNDTTAKDVCHFYDVVRQRVETVNGQAEPAVISLAMSLSPEQIQQIEAKFEKGNSKWRREWSTGKRADRLDKRLRTSVERAEQFYGTLDERQRAVLQAGLTRSGFDPQRSYAERVRRQQDLLQTVRLVSGANGAARLTAAQSGVALRAYVARAIASPDPAYRSYAHAAVLENCQTAAELHNSTTAQQRTRAVARIAAYERDAREIARLP